MFVKITSSSLKLCHVFLPWSRIVSVIHTHTEIYIKILLLDNAHFCGTVIIFTTVKGSIRMHLSESTREYLVYSSMFVTYAQICKNRTEFRHAEGNPHVGSPCLQCILDSKERNQEVHGAQCGEGELGYHGNINKAESGSNPQNASIVCKAETTMKLCSQMTSQFWF